MTSLDDLKTPEKSSKSLIKHPGTLDSRTPETSVAVGIKQPRQVRSDTLLQGDRELQIIHGDGIYRLSVTRQGKLILHK